MKNSTSLDAFVEKIKSDPALRSKIEEAEKSAMADFEKLKKIAKDGATTLRSTPRGPIRICTSRLIRKLRT